MRLLGVVIFVVFLLIHASFGSDAVPAASRKTIPSSTFHDAKKNKPSRESSLDAFNNYFSNSQEQHNSMEEKRVIPTGPNPLHNK